jgi:ABC-type nickel/cobalt efflux system permease component RcnA
MGWRTVIAVLSLGVVLTLVRPQLAAAHPLGNFTINHYSRIELTGSRVHLRYVLDLAEIPAFQEMATIDLDRDAQVSDRERAEYLKRKVDKLRQGLHLSLNGSPGRLQIIEQDLSFPPGQGGLPTLRLSILLRGPPLQSKETEQVLYYRDDNYTERLGWREIVVQAGEGVSLIPSTVSQHDRSNELRIYPADMLNSPPNQREAHLSFVAMSSQDGVGEGLKPTPTAAAEPASRRSDSLSSLITAEQLSLPVVIIALLTALGLGAVHALTPGHGKTIMAAYLVGTRGTAVHALFLGFTVTISHTLGVLGLGLVTLYASHLIAPERLYPWLGLASGTLVAAIGIWLLITRLRGNQETSHHHHRGHDHTFHHAQAPTADGRLSITWKNLAALGIAGGLIPSVSALVLLLAAISMHRIGFGLLLILAFSIGMAGVLAGIGLLLVYTSRLVERSSFDNRPARTLARALPLTTALVVLVSGLVVATRAVFEVGLL